MLAWSKWNKKVIVTQPKSIDPNPLPIIGDK